MQLLKLNNQVCFPLHHAHQLVMKLYQEDLSKFGISYLQYLMILALFEERELTVKELSDRLKETEHEIRNNAIQLEESGYVVIHREGEEILKVLISDFASNLAEDFACVPVGLMEKSGFTVERLVALRLELAELVKHLS